MALSTEWTKRCTDDDDKKATEQAIKSASGVLTILKEILETRLASIERTSVEDYSIPSWSAFQADRNGQTRTLRDIIRLLTLKD